jgi:outer membrane putative beta-barrel porin/alpha-amylase
MPRRIGPSGKLTKVCCAAVGIGWFLTVDLARAGPPFVTDDPEPPPPGGWEINVPFIIERTPGKTEMDVPLFDFNYGLPNVQLKLEFPIEAIQEDHSGTTAGAGDLLLGVKWRFLNNEQSQFQLGTYPQLLVPTADRARGLGQGQPAYLLPFLVQKSWSKWTVYGDVGYWWQLLPKRAITFTPAPCSNVKSTNDSSSLWNCSETHRKSAATVPSWRSTSAAPGS